MCNQSSRDSLTESVVLWWDLGVSYSKYWDLGTQVHVSLLAESAVFGGNWVWVSPENKIIMI